MVWIFGTAAIATAALFQLGAASAMFDFLSLALVAALAAIAILLFLLVRLSRKGEWPNTRE